MSLFWQLLNGIPWYALLWMIACAAVGRFVVSPAYRKIYPLSKGNTAASMFILMLAALVGASVALVFTVLAAAEFFAMIAFGCFALGTLAAYFDNRHA